MVLQNRNECFDGNLLDLAYAQVSEQLFKSCIGGGENGKGTISPSGFPPGQPSPRPRPVGEIAVVQGDLHYRGGYQHTIYDMDYAIAGFHIGCGNAHITVEHHSAVNFHEQTNWLVVYGSVNGVYISCLQTAGKTLDPTT